MTRKYTAYGFIMIVMMILGMMMFVPQAKADAGEVLGTHNPISGYSGPYFLEEGGKEVWCADFGKAEPMANGGVPYSEPQKIEGVSQEDLNIVIYALQEGERAIKSNNDVLAGAVAAVIHASGLNQGVPFDANTMVPEESKADFHRIMNEAPEAPEGAWLTARHPENWGTAGQKDGYQRVLDYDQIDTGILEIEKKDALTGENLEGAEFRVEDMEGNVVIDSRETKNRPYRVQVNAGEYRVIEGTAPKGYTLNGDGSSNENSHVVTIKAGEAQRVTFANTPYPELTINKVDEEGNLLPGATLEITDPDGNKFTTVTKGVPIVIKTRPGDYQVSEVSAPEGYLKEEQTITFNAQSGDKPIVTIVNKKKPEPTSTPVETTTPQQTPMVAPKKPVLTPTIDSHAHINGENVVSKGATITDQITYNGLEAGKEYTLNGVAMCRNENKATPNVAEMTFTPENSSGVVAMDIPIVDDNCKVLVMFQELTLNGEVVAEHKDINDADQTVGTIPQPKKERIIIKSIPSGPVGGENPDILPRS